MFNRSCQRRRGELQQLGEILNAALETANAGYYRPRIKVKPGAKKRTGKLQGVQLDLDFDRQPREEHRPLDPMDLPLADLFPEAYL